jgi:hypothetical protein
VIPTIDTAPGRAMPLFLYPPDGRIYSLVSHDPAKEKILLERLPKPPDGSVQDWPKLQEAQPIYIVDYTTGPPWALLRCTLTEEIEENGKFLTAKYYKNAVVPG